MSNVTITSDGTAEGTKVSVSGKFIKGISKIEFEQIEPDGLVTANLTICMVALKYELSKAGIICDDDVTAEKIRQAIFETGKEND